MMKNKRAVSPIIGYILLIVITISISGGVYIWMKSYIPKETIKCPEDVSIFVNQANCTGGGILNITIKNKGLFVVNGYYIKATTSAEQEIATLSLSGDAGYFGLETPLEPNQEDNRLFTYSGSIYSVEITPARNQTDENGKKRLVVCGDSRIREILPATCQ